MNTASVLRLESLAARVISAASLAGGRPAPGEHRWPGARVRAVPRERAILRSSRTRKPPLEN